MRKSHGAGNNAHGKLHTHFYRMDKEIGMDTFPAVDTEMVAELITGAGGKIMCTEFGVYRSLTPSSRSASPAIAENSSRETNSSFFFKVTSPLAIR